MPAHLSPGAAGPAQQTKIEVRATNQNGCNYNRRRWLRWEALFNNGGDFFSAPEKNNSVTNHRPGSSTVSSS